MRAMRANRLSLLARSFSSATPPLAARSASQKPFKQTKYGRPIKPPPSSKADASQPGQNVSPDRSDTLATSPDTNKNAQVASALQSSASGESPDLGLVAPVHIPEDRHGILRSDHESTSILANSSVVIARQLEMMNVFMGFEQANRYIIHDAQGNHIGYMAEQEHGIGNAVARQMFRTHRSFTAHVFDRHEREVLRFHRPFSWINSRIRVYDALHGSSQYESSSALQGTSASSALNQTQAQVSQLLHTDMRVIGEAQQQWAPLRRKYNLYLHRDLSLGNEDPNAPALTAGELPLSDSKELEVVEPGNESMGMAQFAYVDEPFLSWDFSLKSADDRLIGSVNRNFSGFAREIFTDTGVYALRMDAVGLSDEPDHLISQTHRKDSQADNRLGMTLDQRAVMLATAVSVDFDYFSRHSHAGSHGFMPLWFPMGGGGSAEAGGGAAAGGAAGGTAEAGGGAAAGGAAGGTAEAGAAEAGGAVAGSTGRGLSQGAGGAGVTENAAVGAGTLAGYDMMQRRRDEQSGPPDAGVQPQQSPPPPSSQNQEGGSPWDQDPWGENEDPWGGDKGGTGGSGGGGGGEGGGDGFDIGDWF